MSLRKLIERVLAAAFDVDPGYDVEYDRAFDAALAHGMTRAEANGEATRVADEWQADQRRKASESSEV